MGRGGNLLLGASSWMWICPRLPLLPRCPRPLLPRCHMWMQQRGPQPPSTPALLALPLPHQPPTPPTIQRSPTYPRPACSPTPPPPPLLPWLAGLEVLACDWQAALASAPPPCSRREPLASSTLTPNPLPHFLGPLILHPLAALLGPIRWAGLPLGGAEKALVTATAAAAAATAATAPEVPGGGGAAELQVAVASWQQRLVDLDVLRPAPATACTAQDPAGGRSDPAGRTSATTTTTVSLPAACGPQQGEDGAVAGSSGAVADDLTPPPADMPDALLPGRLLVCLEDRGGHTHVAGPEAGAQMHGGSSAGGSAGDGGASCGSGAAGHVAVSALLRLLAGCSSVVSLSLPGLLLQGQGDAVEGCMQLVGEAVRRATHARTLLLYLPWFELWACTSAPAPGPSLTFGPPTCTSPHASSASRSHMAVSTSVVTIPGQHATAATAGAGRGGGPELAALELTYGRVTDHSNHPARQTHRLLPVAGGAGGAAADGGVTAGSGGSTGCDGGPAEDAPRYCHSYSCITPTWTVFEQLVRQVPPNQPLLVLATCAALPPGLPQQIRDFFCPAAPSPSPGPQPPRTHPPPPQHTPSTSALATMSTGIVTLPLPAAAAAVAPAGAGAGAHALPQMAIRLASHEVVMAAWARLQQRYEGQRLGAAHGSSSTPSAAPNAGPGQAVVAVTSPPSHAHPPPQIAQAGAHTSGSGSDGPHVLAGSSLPHDATAGLCALEPPRSPAVAAVAASKQGDGFSNSLVLASSGECKGDPCAADPSGRNVAELEAGRRLYAQEVQVLRSIAGVMIADKGCALARARVRRAGAVAEDAAAAADVDAAVTAAAAVPATVAEVADDGAGGSAAAEDAAGGPTDASADDADAPAAATSAAAAAAAAAATAATSVAGGPGDPGAEALQPEVAGPGQGQGPGPVLGPESGLEPGTVVSLRDVAMQAMRGSISSLEDLRTAVQGVAAQVRSLRTGQQGDRGARGPGGPADQLGARGGPPCCTSYSRAAAAACQWEDWVASCCHTAAVSLQLYDPDRRALVGAARAWHERRAEQQLQLQHLCSPSDRGAPPGPAALLHTPAAPLPLIMMALPPPPRQQGGLPHDDAAVPRAPAAAAAPASAAGGHAGSVHAGGGAGGGCMDKQVLLLVQETLREAESWAGRWLTSQLGLPLPALHPPRSRAAPAEPGGAQGAGDLAVCLPLAVARLLARACAGLDDLVGPAVLQPEEAAAACALQVRQVLAGLCDTRL